MMLWTMLIIFVIVFFVSGTVLLMAEYLKYSRNPVCLMINHDKRFEKMTSIYLHKVNHIKRGDE